MGCTGRALSGQKTSTPPQDVGYSWATTQWHWRLDDLDGEPIGDSVTIINRLLHCSVVLMWFCIGISLSSCNQNLSFNSEINKYVIRKLVGTVHAISAGWINLPVNWVGRSQLIKTSAPLFQFYSSDGPNKNQSRMQIDLEQLLEILSGSYSGIDCYW